MHYSYHNRLKQLLRIQEYICIKDKAPFVYRFVFPQINKSMPIRFYRVEEYKEYIKEEGLGMKTNIKLITDDEQEIYECCKCHWRFVGECHRFGYGYDSESVETPKYCPMCGNEIKDIEESDG